MIVTFLEVGDWHFANHIASLWFIRNESLLCLFLLKTYVWVLLVVEKF